MFKTLWQKIKQNHLLMMVVCCLVPIVLLVGIISFLKGRNDYWVWFVILLCPLAHIFMMKWHGHKRELYRCPECGLEYKEKEWAEKCESWCKQHKSCNLEITKHAIIRSNKK